MRNHKLCVHWLVMFQGWELHDRDDKVIRDNGMRETGHTRYSMLTIEARLGSGHAITSVFLGSLGMVLIFTSNVTCDDT